MSERAHIYLLTSGDYSDYQVHAAYTQEGTARAAAAAFGGNFRVQVLPLDPFAAEVRKSLYAFRVERYPKEEWCVEPVFYASGELGEVEELGRPGEEWYRVVVLAQHEEQAQKAGMERIQQYRALKRVAHP